MPTPFSDFTFEILASIPRYPAWVSLNDLVTDHGGPMGGRSGLSQAMQAIKGKYGIIEKKAGKNVRVSIPDVVWEQAQAEADEWWHKTH